MNYYTVTTLLKNRRITSPWFVCLKRSLQAKARLFCFPYAGGGPMVFREWPQELPPNIGVYAVHLPGRGARLSESLFTEFSSLMDAIVEAIVPYLDLPFAFYGHSMGAIVSFEVARRLYREHGLEPLHLFVSGRRAPQLPSLTASIHGLPHGEFLDELRRLNGTPPEVLEHPELMQMMAPILRADFSVTQNYEYVDQPRLNCPISAFGGLHDSEMSYDNLEAWREQTNDTFVLRMIPGDHFFLNTARPLLLRIISRELHHALNKTK